MLFLGNFHHSGEVVFTDVSGNCLNLCLCGYFRYLSQGPGGRDARQEKLDLSFIYLWDFNQQSLTMLPGLGDLSPAGCKLEGIIGRDCRLPG